jgi:hypothetical protein
MISNKKWQLEACSAKQQNGHFVRVIIEFVTKKGRNDFVNGIHSENLLDTVFN